MAFVALRVEIDDREAVRWAHAGLAHTLERIGFDADRVGHLIAVAWEIWTNAQQFAAGSIATVSIDEHSRSITLTTTGPAFDSVARAGQPGARGLETAKWRVTAAGCTWSYACTNERNEIRIDYGG